MILVYETPFSASYDDEKGRLKIKSQPPEIVDGISSFIREWICDNLDYYTAQQIRIVYGGHIDMDRLE